MNTDELIRVLVADARPVPAHGMERRFALAVVLGLAGAGGLMLGIFGLRHDWDIVLALPMFWGKFALGPRWPPWAWPWCCAWRGRECPGAMWRRGWPCRLP
nr:NrsF family protein [Paenacidovorax monticola]